MIPLDLSYNQASFLKNQHEIEKKNKPVKPMKEIKQLITIVICIIFALSR